MKRIILLLAIAAATVALPATALAKGPSEARIDGPGIGKAITITGAEEPGSPLMTFAEGAGFFPAAFGQGPNPMLPGRPKGNLGPRYTIDYTVPGPDGESFEIVQSFYPYAKPYAVTYMASGQEIFDFTTRGGWFQASPQLKETLQAAGLPKTTPPASSSNASFFSTGLLSALVVGALLFAGAASIVVRRRLRRPSAA